ncbi:MAG: hypothetical protein HY658_02380 [Actinobacteria bacterium]|nr:hypothetical protein [Actinomycetota bacterium]
MSERETPDPDPAVRLLAEGRGWVDLARWTKVLASGGEAASWLHDLVTAGVESLDEGGATRSLLLTPTGRIRADFQVLRLDEGFLLVQDPAQPRPVGELLAPYVLSADVRLRDRTADVALFALPGRAEAPAGLPGWRPSALGPGVDVLVEADRAEAARDAMREAGLEEVAAGTADSWRVAGGMVRFGVDLSDDALPAEAGLEGTIDLAKGCFLGQESVARVRNLGHPPRLFLAARGEGPVAPGDAVTDGRREVGEVTSAAPVEGGTAAIVRVRWDARDGELRTVAGTRLRKVAPGGP